MTIYLMVLIGILGAQIKVEVRVTKTAEECIRQENDVRQMLKHVGMDTIDGGCYKKELL